MNYETFEQRIRVIDRQVKSMSYRFSVDPYDRDDLEQECRIAILRYNDDDDPSNYIWKTCFNRTCTHMRDERRRAAHWVDLLPITPEHHDDRDDDEPDHNANLADYLGRSHPEDIELEISNREEWRLIEAIADHLPPNLYKILQLRLEGYNKRQISHKLGIDGETTNRRLKAIRAHVMTDALAARLFTNPPTPTGERIPLPRKRLTREQEQRRAEAQR